MSSAAEDLNELSVYLEHIALRVPRHLAVLALTVAAARIVGEAPPRTRASVRAEGEKGWNNTLAEYAALETRSAPASAPTVRL